MNRRRLLKAGIFGAAAAPFAQSLALPDPGGAPPDLDRFAIPDGQAPVLGWTTEMMQDLVTTLGEDHWIHAFVLTQWRQRSPECHLADWRAHVIDLTFTAGRMRRSFEAAEHFVKAMAPPNGVWKGGQEHLGHLLGRAFIFYSKDGEKVFEGQMGAYRTQPRYFKNRDVVAAMERHGVGERGVAVNATRSVPTMPPGAEEFVAALNEAQAIQSLVCEDLIETGGELDKTAAFFGEVHTLEA